MLHLLPEDERNAVKRLYRWRRRAVVAGAVAASIIVALILLIPTYVFSQLSIKELEHQKQSLEKVAEENERPELATSLRHTREIIDHLESDAADRVYVSDVLDRVTEHMGNAISLTGFVYEETTVKEEGEETDATIARVTGVSRDREALFAFKEAITAVDLFQNVELPLSSLAESTDIQFTLSMTIDAAPAS